MSFKTHGEAFLADNPRLAVFGISRSDKAHTGNYIYKALKDAGYNVVAIHPHAEEIQLEGDPCYHSLAEVPEHVDGAIIVTAPEATPAIVEDCYSAGVNRVWFHYNPLFGKGNSSVATEAVEYCRAHNIDVIEGGCPLMFIDVGHKCMRWVLEKFHKLPA